MPNISIVKSQIRKPISTVNTGNTGTQSLNRHKQECKSQLTIYAHDSTIGIPSLKLTNEGTKKIKHFEYERLLYVINYLNPRQRLRNLRIKQKCFQLYMKPNMT